MSAKVGCVLLLLLTVRCDAATMHGRVKDQQCMVLARVHGTIRSMEQTPHTTTTAFDTDEGGNYNMDLAPGQYELCLQRERSAARACELVTMPATGDKWIVTQMHESAPDLSTIGNHAYGSSQFRKPEYP